MTRRALRAPRARAGCVRAALATSLATSLATAAVPMLAATAAATLAPASLRAQGVRIRGTTWARYVELRPFVEDSVPRSGVTGDVDGYGTTADGRVVRCGPSDTACRYLRSGARVSTVPVLQDFALTAWGLGEGISVHAAGRLRQTAGSRPASWPRADDRFDALEAYVKIDRRRVGARLGRQWLVNGLGVANFDGVTLDGRPGFGLDAQAWGGRALVRGLNESFTSGELGSVDDLPPDRGAYVGGLALGWRGSGRARGAAVRGVYQREIRTNRSGLYSERAGLDASWRVGRGAVDATWTHDLATNAVNDAGVRGRASLGRGLALTAEVRRSRPFFELWTIWGAFSPIGFDEARGDLSWGTRDGAVRVTGRSAYRRWQPTLAGLDFAPLRRDAWRLGGDVQWQPRATLARGGLALFARYDADVGAGASRADGDLGLRWTSAGGRLALGGAATAWQSIYEFRIGTERVAGALLDASVAVRPDVRIAADVAHYRTAATQGAPTTDWGQTRAALRLEWTVGGDPGRSRAPARGARP